MLRPQDEFRIYYNHTIFPELVRLERQRRRLLNFLVASAILLLAILILQIYVNILIFTLVASIPVFFYLSYVLYQIRHFQRNFKPRIVRLLLDFIDESPNYGTLAYEGRHSIPRKVFLESNIFVSDAPDYVGEDYISGRIGDIEFELCEIRVREFSRVRNRLNDVFQGLFLHARFNRDIRGRLLILPEAARQYLSRTVREADRNGCRFIPENHFDPPFAAAFNCFATEDTNLETLLSTDMQRAIANYREQTGKEIYLSFMDSRIFACISEPDDLLEPFLFRSNVSFDLIRVFYDNIHMALKMVEEIDRNT